MTNKQADWLLLAKYIPQKNNMNYSKTKGFNQKIGRFRPVSGPLTLTIFTSST
jgi:hypothetical protein